MRHFLIEAPLALLPVLAFLAVLVHLESFRLVRLVSVIQVLAAGALVAALSYAINGQLLDALHVNLQTYVRFVSPVVEEIIKALVLVFLFMRNRIGFMVDAAILGFAIGAGFSVVENIYYLYSLPEANVGVWIVRGFGTAVMHGGATAIVGITAQSVSDRRASSNLAIFLPGLVLAIALHGAFNNSAEYPMVATATAFLVLPLAILFVFSKSEHAVHNWMLSDYASHEHLLRDIRTGAFRHSEAGRFILDLANRFDEATVADIFAYVRLHTELIMRIDKVALAREEGKYIAITESDWHRFDRLHALEERIGKTALLAVWPHLPFSRKELWEIYRAEHERHSHIHVAPPEHHQKRHGLGWLAIFSRRPKSPR